MSRTVVNGEVRQFSVSALELADTRVGGCMRKWYYRYVLGVREPDTDDARRGTLMHDHLKVYLTTGVLPPPPALFSDEAAALAAAMAHKAIASGIVPAPGGDLLVEVKIDDWGMTAADVRLRGVIDLLHTRCENAGVSDVADAYDEPGTIAVRDWKSKKSKASADASTKYLLTSADLPRSIQMAGYGLAALKRFPAARRVRLEHGYAFTERPGPRVVTRLTTIDELSRTWEYVDALGRSIRDVARETNVEKVDANRFACDRYGPKYLCTHAPYCTGYRNNTTTTLATLFGDTAAKDLSMSLMNSLTPPPGFAAQAQPAAVGTNGTIVNLAAEEAALRHQHELIAQGQSGLPIPQPAGALAAPGTFQPSMIPPGFTDAWRAILAANQGQPALAGAAAQALAMVCGQQLAPNASYAGAGPMSGIVLTEAMQVLQVAGDFGWRPAAAPAPIAPPPAAPAAPPPTPAPVMQHVQHAAPAPMMSGSAPSVIETREQYDARTGTTRHTAPSILPPDAPAPNPALAARPLENAVPTSTIQNTLNAVAPGLGTAVVASLPTLATEPPAKRRGRPPGTGRKPAADVPANTSVNLATGNGATAAIPDIDTGGYALEIFVDCVPNGDDVVSLDAYVDRTCAALVAKFCPPPAIPDVRAAPNDGPLGFGRWKGAVGATVREVPPPPGRYVLRVRGDELRSEVANALRQVCESVGGLYVDGR